MSYTPPQEILERYGEVMVNYGLGNGAGIKPGDVVGITCREDAKPLLLEVANAVWRAGGHVIVDYQPANDANWNLNRAFYDLASDEQLDYYPDGWRRACWSGCLYGTEATAAEAGMTLEKYWDQIIHACYLDDRDPVTCWRSTAAEIRQTVGWLNQLDIDRLHVEAEGTDLWVSIGEQRRWIGGESVNVPSFEIATSPDWRGTNGHIAFSEPLYRRGTVMRGVRLTFRDGEVVGAAAEEGQAELTEMVATDPGAAHIGEYSLTDGRHSRITRFMANTLFDENRGGPAGNTHLALGQSMEGVYTGDVANATPEELASMGFNASNIHVDIISTTDRTVTATLRDGSTLPIYAGGQFLHDERPV